MTTVLCLGEALIDVVHAPGREPSEFVGGSPLNVAGGLARLGHHTRLAAWFAADSHGAMIQRWLDEHAVLLAPGSDGAEFTPTAIATLDEQGQASYTFDLVWDLPEVDLDGIAHVHTGSIAAVLQPGADKVLEVLRRAKDAGATISYDPNMRPALMGQPDDVRGRVEQIISLADVVKASDEDITWLYPDDVVEEVLELWVSMGPGLVVMTRGALGAVALQPSSDTPITVEPRRVQSVDSVGAGDSFMAGLVSGLLDDDLLGTPQASSALYRAPESGVGQALARAATTSSITVTHAGAYAPTRAELDS